MLAVLFALVTGVLFGALAVTVQRGLRVGGDAAVGLLVVAGGAGVVRERVRPEHFRWLGAILALICAVLFGVRDNVARWAARGNNLPPLVAAAASLAAATLLVLAYLLIRHRDRLGTRLGAAIPAFAPAAVVFGGCYVFLFEAY